MYKLRFRCNWPLLAVSVLLPVSILILVIKCYPDCVMEVNLFFFACVEVIVAIAIAYFVAENAPPSDFIRAALTVLLVTMLYGALGNLVSQTTMILPDFAMLINYLQWAVMEVGGALAVFVLYKVEPISIYAPDSNMQRKTKEQKLAQGTNPGPQPATQSVTNMRSPVGLSDSKISTPNLKERMSASSLLHVLEKLINLKSRVTKNELLVEEATITESETSLSQVTETIEPKAEENKPAPTPTRLVASRKRATSTFTKLQALSKSGTGVQKHLAGEHEGDGEGLSSILGRLETSKFGDDELSPHSLFSSEHKLGPTDTTSESEDKGQIDSSPIGTFKEAEHIDKSAIEANKPVKPKPEIPSTKIEKKTEPSEVVGPAKADIGARLMGALNAQSKATDLSSVVEAKALEVSIEAPIKVDSSEIVDKKETLLGGGIDGAIDDVFSNLVPQEAFREVKDRITTEEPKVAEDLQSSPNVDLTEPELADETASEKTLFGTGVDKEIDDIFSNLAPPEAQVNVSEAMLAKMRGEDEAVSAHQGVVKAENELKDTPLSEMTNRSEAALPLPRAQSAQLAEDKAGSSADAATGEHESPLVKITDSKPMQHDVLREFGRLSAKSALPPTQSESAGTMKTIGKLLNEVQVVVKIIEAERTGTSFGAGLTTARVISAVKGEGIKQLLNKIDTYPEVIGTIIVGLDGLVIVSTLGETMDKDMLGAMSVAVMGSSGLATKKLEIGRLKQMVLVGNDKITVLTDVDIGILAVFMETSAVDKIDGLLKAIHDTIHG